MPRPATTGGSWRRRQASAKMSAITSQRTTPFTSAARVSVRIGEKASGAGGGAGAVKKGGLDPDPPPPPPAAPRLNGPPRGRGRPAGRQQVVDDQHAMAIADGVVVDLERVAAVLELVAGCIGLVRELARLAHQRQPRAETVGHGGADDEAAGLDPEHDVDPPPVVIHEAV